MEEDEWRDKVNVLSTICEDYRSIALGDEPYDDEEDAGDEEEYYD